MSQTRFKVFVLNKYLPRDALELLRRSCDVTICESDPPERSEILQKVRGVHGLFWIGREPVDAELLDAAGPQLKAVSNMTTGFDHVDIAELRRRKIPLGITPKVPNESLADTTIGLMLAAARLFHEGRQKILTSTWEVHNYLWMLGQDVRGATVGFFGFGGIGQAAAKRLGGFDIAGILYNKRRRISIELEQKFNAKMVSFDDLLTQSDFILICAPYSTETEKVFNAAAFKKMKKTAVLVNISRGELINQDDLYEALKTKQIFAAGIDVTVPEPLPADHKLLTLPNLIITPHLGSATMRTRIDMGVTAAHNLLLGMAGQKMISSAQ